MHIFISYAKKETYDLARQLHAALEAVEGITAWMDESLAPAESWAFQIQDEIDRCDLMIVLLSPDVNRRTGPRSFVLHEIDYAQQERKPILPVMAQNTKQPIQIAGVQYIDLTRDGARLAAVVEAVCRRGGITSPPAPDRKTSPPGPLSTRGEGEKPRVLRVEDILPPPFAWCDIPAGQVEIEGHGWFEVPAFKMAKYPITNAQYAAFITDADGYRNDGWWDYAPEARGWRKEHPKPDNTAFAGDDLPRTYVNWYDALAFTYWLGFKLGEKITLPTEMQWQRAAQGDDGREYPWGNEPPTKDLCNFGYNVGQTTPVTRYPEGASSYGVMDMSGNVWEWCLNMFDDPKASDLAGDGSRVVRGGSWFFDARSARCAYRGNRQPFNRHYNLGFRVVCAAPMN